MKLTSLDRKFIEFMADRPEHRQVISAKIENASEILIQTPENWYRVFARNLALLLYLFLEVGLVSPRRKPADTTAIIAFDTNVNNIDDRATYFRHNLPQAKVEIVTFHSKFIRLPGFKNTLGQLFRLVGFLLRSLFQPSELSKEYVRIVRGCLLVHGYLLTSTQPAVFLCHPHRWDTTFLAAYLRENGYYVNLVATPYTPLAVHNKYLVADSIKLGDSYQVAEFQVFNKLGTCHHCELWPVARSYELAEHYQSRKPKETRHILGLYTQGFWLRMQIGKASETIGKQLAKQEQELIQGILDYLNQYPDVHLIVYPHPKERRHFQLTGKHQFGRLESMSRVKIDFEGANSIYDFDQVGLGITTVSSSGFERLSLGFRTLFYIPYVSFMDLSVRSPYNALFTSNKGELFGKIDRVRPMSNEDFFHHFLDGQVMAGREMAFQRFDSAER
jgi:hypothetical protein